MVCSPARCMSLVHGILNRRRKVLRARGLPDVVNEKPVFVWEPVPDLCTPEELVKLREAAGYVDVVSPNEDEFAAFFKEMPTCKTRETQVEWLLESRSKNGVEKKRLRAALVIREGAHGCTTYAISAGNGLHLRAFHQSEERVIDPTGGGNTFLGALAIGLTGVITPDGYDLETLMVPDDTRRFSLALVHATVAAAYAIEQTGMPSVSASDGDAWNDEGYSYRFVEYVNRERGHIVSQLQGGAIRP